MSKAKGESIRQSLTLDQWTSGINTMKAAPTAQLQTTSGRFQGATRQDTGSEGWELLRDQVRVVTKASGHSQGKAASVAVAALSAVGTEPVC